MSRFWRLPLLLVATASVLALPAAAFGVGTGGIELTPIPARTASGKPITSFKVRLGGGESKPLRFLLRNVVKSPATAEIYAAAATRSADGRFAVGGRGSAPWIRLAPQTVTLAPQEQRIVTFTVTGKGAPDDPVGYGAVLVQVGRGAVVERAATIVSLTRRGSDRTVPLILAGGAALLLLAAGALVGWRAYAARATRGLTASPPR